MTDKPPDTEDKNKSGGNGDDKGAGNDKGEKTRTFTQSELDALFTERATRAAEKAVSELLSKSGVKTVDELTATLDEAKKLKAGQQTEAERLQAELKAAQDKAAAAETERQNAITQATEKLMKAQVLAEAVAQGFRPEAVNDVWLIVDRTKIKEKDGEFIGVNEAVADVVKSKPFWLIDKTKPTGTPKPGEKKAGGDKEPEPLPRINF